MYGNDVASDFQMALRVADEQSPFGKRLQIFCHIECSVKFVMLSIKVAFFQKGLMRLSFLQTGKPDYFPELKF